MITHMLNINESSFFYYKAIDVVVLFSKSEEYVVYWTIHSSCLFLDPINIDHFLQIFITIVVIFHVEVYERSQFCFNLWILSYEVDYGHEVVRSSICTSKKKCIELLKYLLFKFGIYLSIFRRCTKKCLDNIKRILIIRVLFYSLLNLDYSFFYKISSP